MGMKPVVGLVGCFWLGMALGGCDCCRPKNNSTYNAQPTFPSSSQTTQQGLTQGGSVQSASGAGVGAGANPNSFASSTGTPGGFNNVGTGAANPNIAAASGGSGSFGLPPGGGSSATGIQRASFQESSIPTGTASGGNTAMRDTAPPYMYTPPTPKPNGYDIPPPSPGLLKSAATDSTLSSQGSAGYQTMSGSKTGGQLDTHDMSAGAGSWGGGSGANAALPTDSSMKDAPPAFSGVKSGYAGSASGMSPTPGSEVATPVGGSPSPVLPTSSMGGSSSGKGNSSIGAGSGSTGSSVAPSGLPGFGQ